MIEEKEKKNELRNQCNGKWVGKNTKEEDGWMKMNLSSYPGETKSGLEEGESGRGSG